MSDQPTCESCRFWAGYPEYITAFECRRKSPKIVWNDGTILHRAIWPATSKDDWCGEHEATAKQETNDG